MTRVRGAARVDVPEVKMTASEKRWAWSLRFEAELIWEDVSQVTGFPIYAVQDAALAEQARRLRRKR